jgi:hypothetical protein
MNDDPAFPGRSPPSVLGDVGGAIGEITALGDDTLSQLLHVGEPGSDITSLDRLEPEPNPLIFG